MAYYLAVDAGGTKAEFLLADEEREIERVRCGTIKRTNTDEAQARANLERALEELEQRTGVNPAQVKRTCIGTSGETVPLVTDWLRENFCGARGRRAGDCGRCGDCAGCGVPFGGRAAAACWCWRGRDRMWPRGTGTATILRAGGWGPMLADQGAGHWIGVEGLRRGFLARDEGRATDLLERARKLWKLPSENALIEFANAQLPQRYGSQFAQ